MNKKKMLWTKISLLLTVISTVLSGLYFDQSVPYFPIEISRTATGPWSRIIFPVGVMFVMATCIWEVGRMQLPFVGLFILALVDDKTSWILHMLGVFIMGVSLAFDAWKNSKLLHFFLIFCIYCGRLVLKMGVTYHYGMFQNAIETSKQIMYTGNAETQEQLLIFKLCGILQWVVLYGWMELYCIKK